MAETKDGPGMFHDVRGARIRTATTAGNTAEVVLLGEFDLDNGDALEAALAEQIDAGRSHLTLQAAGVTFMDSTVLAVLLRAHRRCVDAGGSFALAGVRGSVARLIETTGLDQIIRKGD